MISIQQAYLDDGVGLFFRSFLLAVVADRSKRSGSAHDRFYSTKRKGGEKKVSDSHML